MTNQYRSGEMFRAFKRLRNRIRNYYPEEILNASKNLLQKLTPDRFIAEIHRTRKTPPWNLFLLLKWAIMYGDYLSPRRKRLSNNDFGKLQNLVHDVCGEARLPNQYRDTYLFFRTIAFQQLWFQESLERSRLARQNMLFGNLSPSHSYRKWFIETVGIDIDHFIELSVMLICRFLDNATYQIQEKWFDNVRYSYPEGSITRFLNAISRDLHSLKDFLNNQAKTADLSFEYYEQTPLKRYPLLKSDSVYQIYSLHLLLYSLQDFIYDVLRTNDAAGFMTKFGETFEKYVEKGLSYSGLDFLKENQLKRAIGKGKVVDFLVFSEDCNIYIDAKGVELGFSGMVHHNPEIIGDKIKPSILKGIQQSFATASRISDLGKSEIDGVRVGASVNFLLIVTFKDLYLSNGRILYEIIAQERLDRLQNEFGNKQWIPFENMYFISIDDFDILMEHVKSGRGKLAETLKKAVTEDSVPSSSRFHFRQHLEATGEICIPQFLVDNFGKIFDRCRTRIEEAENSSTR